MCIHMSDSEVRKAARHHMAGQLVQLQVTAEALGIAAGWRDYIDREVASLGYSPESFARAVQRRQSSQQQNGNGRSGHGE